MDPCARPLHETARRMIGYRVDRVPLLRAMNARRRATPRATRVTGEDEQDGRPHLVSADADAPVARLTEIRGEVERPLEGRSVSAREQAAARGTVRHPPLGEKDGETIRLRMDRTGPASRSLESHRRYSRRRSSSPAPDALRIVRR